MPTTNTAGWVRTGLLLGQSQTVGTVLLVIGSVWVSWSVLHRAPSASTVSGTQPRVS